MALWSFKIRKICSGGQVLLLRFYMANLYHLGWMRLQYSQSRNEVQLTSNSIKTSKIILVFLIFYQTKVLCDGLGFEDDIGIVVFIFFSLITPRTVIKKQVRLINNFLRISSKLNQHCKVKILWGWSILIALFLKIIYVSIFFEFLVESNFIELLFVLPRIIMFWVISVVCHLTSIAISLLVGYTEWVTNKIYSIEEKIPQAIQQNKIRDVRRLTRKITSLLNLHQMCTRITGQIFDCLGPQIVVLAFYNLCFLPTLHFQDLNFKLINILGLYGLKDFIFSLEKLTIGARRKYFFSDRDWWNHTFMTNLAKPQRKVLGLVTPSRQLFFRILFANCSRMYLKYMWYRIKMKNERNKL
ncbi:hypothetical protein KR074_009704 [Drosophila pseudoananassae]|nr:hypothetical protein KR074_009704 [Drosophila pseudoananassae]